MIQLPARDRILNGLKHLDECLKEGMIEFEVLKEGALSMKRYELMAGLRGLELSLEANQSRIKSISAALEAELKS